MKKVLVTVLVAMLSLSIVGCGAEESKPKEEGSKPAVEESKAEEASSEATQGFIIKYPEALKKGFGEELVLEKKPERIVCMTSGPVQTLYELGVEMVAIPDSGINAWPEDLKAEKLPFGMGEIDTEAIFAMEPDFVILSTGNKEKYGKLFEDKGIPVYYVVAGPAVTYSAIKDEVKVLGEAFKAEEKMNAILEKFTKLEERAAKIKESGKAEKAMILFGYPPSYVQTKTGYLGGMLDMMGFTNVTDGIEISEKMSSSIPLNMEEVLNYNPDIIFATSPSTKTPDELKGQFAEEFEKNKKVWGSLEAVKSDKVVYLGSEYSKSAGIKSIDSITALMDQLFPDIK